jgi:hypothetical protein
MRESCLAALSWNMVDVVQQDISKKLKMLSYSFAISSVESLLDSVVSR